MKTESEHEAKTEHEHHFSIIVNAREKGWHHETISFEEVVELAFDTYMEHEAKGYTVKYSKGHEPKPDGLMSKGSKLHVKNKMNFIVTTTDRS